jgi:hypothetical protein
MKKTDKETKGTTRLRFSSETIRVLRTSDLQQVAGGTDEGLEGNKRPT